MEALLAKVDMLKMNTFMRRVSFLRLKLRHFVPVQF